MPHPARGGLSCHSLTVGNSLMILTSTESDSAGVATRRYTDNPSIGKPHVLFDPAGPSALQLVRWDDVDRTAGPDDLVHDGPVHFVDIVCYANRLPSADERPEWWQAIATYLEMAVQDTGTEVYFPAAFVPFMDGTGLHSQRFAREDWEDLGGIIGAQHVPNSSQGEPGDFSPLADLMTGVGLGDKAIIEAQEAMTAAGFWSGPSDGYWSDEFGEAVSAMTGKYSELWNIAKAQTARLQSSDQERLQNAEVTRMAVGLDQAMRPVIRSIVLDEMQKAGLVQVQRKQAG